MTKLVLTVLGDDRPGLVDALSGLIEAHDGNWEQSRMAHLANKFAGILLVTLPDNRVQPLTHALRMLASEHHLNIAVESSQDEGQTPNNARVKRLALVGQDHPGIVHDISHALAAHEVSVEELESTTESASMAGGSLFRARLSLRVPERVTDDDLREILESLADEIMVDVNLDEED